MQCVHHNPGMLGPCNAVPSSWHRSCEVQTAQDELYAGWDL